MRLTASILLTLSTAALGMASEHKLSAELRGVAPDAAVDVMVKYRHAPTAEHHNRISARVGELRESLDIIRAAHYSIAAGQLEALSDDPNVESISPDQPVFATWKPVYPVIYTENPDYGWRTGDLAKSVFVSMDPESA